jgi:hypothetical protein
LRTLLLLAVLACLLPAQEPVEKGPIYWNPVRTAVEQGDKTEAMKALRRLLDQHTGYDLAEDARTLTCLQGERGLQELLQQASKDFPSQVRSRGAFVISDRNLVPEGLAFDPVGRAFYLGSLSTAKICRISMGGAVTDFVTQNGLGVVVGLRVDAQHRILWAANQGRKEAGLWAFDLGTGKFLRKAVIPAEGHFFNDLAVGPDGDVYATDSDGSKLYRLRPAGNTLEALDLAVRRPNGIALSADGKTLFVSEMTTGILRVDTATFRSEPLGRPGTLSLLGIDGLYAEGRTLVALHNWYTPTQIIRYHLDAALRQVERVEVLERKDPTWKLPTTGAIAEGWFYFIANAQVDRYDNKRNALTPGPPLEPIRILKTRL